LPLEPVFRKDGGACRCRKNHDDGSGVKVEEDKKIIRYVSLEW